MVTHLVVDYTEIDVGEEFTCNISNLLVFRVELDSVLVVIWVLLAHLHVINADAVVCERLSVHVTNGAANLQELLILSDGLFVLAKIIVQNTRGVVCTALITRFSSTFACEGEHFVIFKSFLG